MRRGGGGRERNNEKRILENVTDARVKEIECKVSARGADCMGYIRKQEEEEEGRRRSKVRL